MAVTATIVLISGLVVAYNCPSAGNIYFSIGWIITFIFDSCLQIITTTMIMSKMQADSRGVMISIQKIAYGVAAIGPVYPIAFL